VRITGQSRGFGVRIGGVEREAWKRESPERVGPEAVLPTPTAAHATDADSFSAVVRCRDPGGGVFMVTLGRETVTVSSYSADAVLATVENWADAVPALA